MLIPGIGHGVYLSAVGNVLSEILYDFVPGHTRIVGVLAVEIIVIVFAGAFHLFFGDHQEVIMIIDILVFIQGYVCLEVNVDLAFVTGILGCYNNDSVCGARTVDSRRCSVFQNVHRSDVIGIEVFDRAFDRKTVHNEQRSRFAIERTRSADNRFAAVGRQTGNASLKILDKIRSVTVTKFFGGDGGYRPGHFLFLDFLVTGNDNFFHLRHIFQHDNM